MRNITKKMIMAGTAAVTAMVILTACAKTTEKTEDNAVEAEDPDTQVSEQKDGGNGQTFGAEGEENEQASDKKDGENERSSEQEEENTFHFINEDKDLYGDIVEIGENQFTVTEIHMETLDTGEIMVSSAPETEESPKITVTYDENTKFVKQKIWDGGAGHEEKEGTAADLEKGFTAEMNGSYEGDVFHATEIRIVEVILE